MLSSKPDALKSEFSTIEVSPKLTSEIVKAVKAVGDFGSVELYIQHSKVTQITTRKINKTG